MPRPCERRHEGKTTTRARRRNRSNEGQRQMRKGPKRKGKQTQPRRRAKNVKKCASARAASTSSRDAWVPAVSKMAEAPAVLHSAVETPPAHLVGLRLFISFRAGNGLVPGDLRRGPSRLRKALSGARSASSCTRGKRCRTNPSPNFGWNRCFRTRDRRHGTPPSSSGTGWPYRSHSPSQSARPSLPRASS